MSNFVQTPSLGIAAYSMGGIGADQGLDRFHGGLRPEFQASGWNMRRLGGFASYWEGEFRLGKIDLVAVGLPESFHG